MVDLCLDVVVLSCTLYSRYLVLSLFGHVYVLEYDIIAILQQHSSPPRAALIVVQPTSPSESDGLAASSLDINDAASTAAGIAFLPATAADLGRIKEIADEAEFFDNNLEGNHRINAAEAARNIIIVAARFAPEPFDDRKWNLHLISQRRRPLRARAWRRERRHRACRGDPETAGRR